MKSVASTNPSSTTPMLNLGCGRRFHPDWVNVDLDPTSEEVLGHDITRGLPFDDLQFTAVYHSHVLEHLSPDAGRELIQECFRVLQPGGTLRIVVPDLEQIARLYLQTHDQAWGEQTIHAANYEWIKLELLDQLVRDRSGGQMGQYMTNRCIENEDFVRRRLGDEFVLCQDQPTASSGSWGTTWRDFRLKMTRRLIRWLLGREAQQAFDEGWFRSQGEIHRWMYDRFSLRQLCHSIGFENFQICTASTSQIVDFAGYELDAVENRARKPDSIFVECQKPRIAGNQEQSKLGSQAA